MRRSSSALRDRGVVITVLLGLIGWVLPPSRMPTGGTSAPEPDPTWPSAQPSSRTFGRSPEPNASATRPPTGRLCDPPGAGGRGAARARAVPAGVQDLVVAGGAEVMSQVPI